MRRIYLSMIAVLMAMAMLCACALKQERSVSFIERVSVKLTYQDGTCTGTIIGPQAILTAAHCHEVGNPLKLDGRYVTVIDSAQDGKDHIIYRVTERFPVWASVGPKPKLGDKARLLGNPRVLERIYREGTYSGQYDGRDIWDLNTWFGDSGAGIFNDQGEVVAVMSQAFAEGPFSVAGSFPMEFKPDDWARVTK